MFNNSEIKIRKKITDHGFITLSDFINEALYGQYGYYTTQDPLSYTDGDFITSPLIHQIFGEIIAIACMVNWDKLINRKKSLTIVELGSGSGIMALDMMNVFRQFNDFYSSMNIFLVDCSDKMRKIQKQKLVNHLEKVTQFSSVEEAISCLSADSNVFFVANEFFDAISVNQYIFKDNNWYISIIKENFKGDLIFSTKPIDKLPKSDFVDFLHPIEGDIIEYSSGISNTISLIKKTLNIMGGYGLFIDYGCINKRCVSTIRSFYKNKILPNIFFKIGLSDITHDLNFKIFGQYKDYCTQKDFLYKYGLKERVEILSKKCDIRDRYLLSQAIDKLTASHHMGEKFKAIEL
ncbi:hypothetical protein GUI12_02470 [Anaplasmataceae bacterium AB001_6]|nr:hypothetical protein GUI12_02470 [Anaplasmataceae bacterium AB001_6]